MKGTSMTIILQGDGAFADVPKEKLTHVQGITAASRLPCGTDGGRSTVCFRIDLPDGRVVLAETTLRLLDTAVQAMKAADERDAKAGGGRPA